MSQITRSYTFTDGTTAYGSQVESEISNIVTVWNAHDNGSSSWQYLKASTQLIGKGTATNDAASTGFIGEYLESIISSPVNMPTSTQWGDLTSISLTAGDWDVNGIVSFELNGATATGEYAGGLSSTTGNSTPAIGSRCSTLAPTASVISSVSLPNIRFSLASTTTVYLKYSGVFSAGTPQSTGAIRARRIR